MLQQHMYSYGDEVIVFPNRRYLEEYHKNVTTDLVKTHKKAFSSNSFSEFLDKRLFWIYMRVPKLCQCKKFWQFGRCKHELAVKLFKKRTRGKSV